jgi:hypothetical protein
MVCTAVLRLGTCVRHDRGVEDTEATQSMLEALFDVKVKVSEIHAVVVGIDEDEDGEEEEEEDA